MIIDLTLKNFRSFKDEQMLSMSAETGLARHSNNLHVIENGKIAVIRSAAILGPNASGKSNILLALQALKWLINSSGDRKEGQSILPYEPYKLDPTNREAPIEFEIEFVVPTGVRYRYEVSYSRNSIMREVLHSYQRRQRALIFNREASDTWETVRFGGTYKGGARRISFFPNQTYISRAGNDAAAPDTIREIYRYFRSIVITESNHHSGASTYYENPENLRAVSDFLCLADTGIKNITADENPAFKDIKFPDDMPEEIRELITDENKFSFSFWSDDSNGQKISFDENEISDGTLKLFKLMPIFLYSLSSGTPVLIDELDGNLHTSLVSLILSIYNDSEINKNGAQIIFTTHDTNILNPNLLRRDQIWLVDKKAGTSQLRAVDSFDKRLVRADSPFEDFYIAGRLGALPKIETSKIRAAIAGVISKSSPSIKG